MATIKQDVTNVTLALSTGTVCTPVAIAADTTTLIITPTTKCTKLILLIVNSGADYAITCAAGDYWAGKAITEVTMSAETRAFVFEAARSMQQGVATNADATDLADRIVVTLGAAATTTTAIRVLELP